MNNEMLNRLVDRLAEDVGLQRLTGPELDERIQNVRTCLGMLDQMLKMPSGEAIARMHKAKILKDILRDVVGARGERMTL